MHRLAIFASGSGTNAENIIRYFQNKPQIKVSCICTNRADAYVTERVRPYNIPVFIISRQDFYETDKILDYLKENNRLWLARNNEGGYETSVTALKNLQNQVLKEIETMEKPYISRMLARFREKIITSAAVIYITKIS